jgi:hypothetical protein
VTLIGTVASSDAGDCTEFSVHDAHLSKWAPVADLARRHFAGYANAGKLTTLLEFWLFAHRSFIDRYGEAAAAEFCRESGDSHLRYSWYVEFGVDIRLPRSQPKDRATCPVAW